MLFRSAAALTYIAVRGGDPPGEMRTIKAASIADLAATARDRLQGLIAAYDDPDTPYRAMRRAAFRTHYDFDPYEHLARVAEWSADEPEGEA